MKLDKTLKPKKDYKLSRIGRNNDGGYLVSENTIRETEFLVSLGINEDWSFEKSFYNIKNVKIHCYDQQNTEQMLIKSIILSFVFYLRRFNFQRIKNSITNYLDFLKFKKKAIFIKKKIFYNDLDKILLENSSEKIFLKIDIEGCEYRILEDIIKHQDRITGLVCEFHDVDLHKEVIYKFINNFKLHYVHIHPNNNGLLDKEGNPTVLELTFEKNPQIIGEEKKIPNILDQNNNSEFPEQKLEFN